VRLQHGEPSPCFVAGAADARLLGALHAAGCIRRTPSAWKLWANKVCALGTECASEELTGLQTKAHGPNCLFAGKEMEAKWEQNSRYFIFFITFMAVTTIGSKFVPKTKPKKEIIDKRAAKEARTQHTPTRAHALAHAPANIRASALVRACTRACVPSVTIITLHPFSPCAGKGEETRPRP